MKKLRILIADDHAIVRFGISTLINSTGDMEVTAMASNGEEAVETARRLAPDIVIMDLMMPKKDGIAATQEIKESLPETSIRGDTEIVRKRRTYLGAPADSRRRKRNLG